MNKNKYEWILSCLAKSEDRVALVCKNQKYTYQELLTICNKWLAFIKESNIAPGTTVAVCGNYSPNTCALFLALLVNKNIVVPIDSTTDSNKDKFMEIAFVESIIQFTNDEEYSFLVKKKQETHPLYQELQRENAPGIVLFSSGSTGASKAIVLNAEHILETYKKPRKGFVTLAFLLIDHIGGINTMLHVLLSGGTLVSSSDKSPHHICSLIQDFKVELLPTTPTFLNLLISSGFYQEYDLSSLKIVTYGTEPMGQNTLNHIAECLPHVTLKQTYGLSEVGILPTKSQANNSLWFQIRDDVPYKIIDGILFLKMKTAMLGYLNAPSPIDEFGWFNTGDSVLTKEENGALFLRILGRKSEIINVGGEKVYPAEIEDVLLMHPLISDAVVYSQKNPVMGQIVVAKINLLPHADVQLNPSKLIRQYCTKELEAYKIPQIIEICEQPLYGARFKKNRVADTVS